MLIAVPLGHTQDFAEMVEVPMETHLVAVDITSASPSSSPASPANVDRGCVASVRAPVQNVVEHVAFRIVIMVLIILDFIFIVVDLATDSRDVRHTFDVISMIFSSVFLLELIARIFSRGLERFFIVDIPNIIDTVVIVATFIISVIALSAESSPLVAAKFFVIGRFIRLPRLIVLIRVFYTERKTFSKASRRMVSENKRRFNHGGFDLDLCYITDRVIATSFPSSGLQAMYRNPIREVARFLDTYHAGHYKIYNMCSERSYDSKYFHGSTGRVLIDDHNPPLLEDMLNFAAEARTWMDANEENVLVVHCKGGKGRTGTMICVHLIDNGTFQTAEEVLEFFGSRRTDFERGDKFQGVETPSQSRYVGYFETLKHKLSYRIPEDRLLTLKSIELHGMKTVGVGDGSDFRYEMYEGRNLVQSLSLASLMHSVQEGREKGEDKPQNLDAALLFNIPDAPAVKRDVKMMFFCSSKSVPVAYAKCAFFFWFYTSFTQGNKLSLTRTELDNPHKKQTWNVYGEDFKVVLNFESE